MSLLVQPANIKSAVLTTGLIYGQPGVGKSTTSLSGPNSVMIDADNGIHRVQPRWRVASMPLNNYEDLLKLLNSDELDPFNTMVIDTLGKLVDRIGEYVIRKNPKSGRGNGALSMQGWGDVKSEFLSFLKLAKSKRKYLVFVAHEREEKEGEGLHVRPDVAGSSGKELLKELDYVGYMESRGGETTISFTPSDKHYAKNALKLPSIIKVPNPEVTGRNDFLQKNIIERTEQNNVENTALNSQYDKVIAANAADVAITKDERDVNLLAVALNKPEHESIWDSTLIAKKALMARAAVLGLEFDKELKLFRVKKDVPAEGKPADTSAQVSSADTTAQNSATAESVEKKSPKSSKAKTTPKEPEEFDRAEALNAG